MHEFDAWLDNLKEPGQRETMVPVLGWIAREYPRFERVIKWNQPMFTDHGTFIIGFAASKGRFTFMIEREALKHFAAEVLPAGYTSTENIVRVRWDQDVDYALLRRMIEFKIAEKADTTTFWRPGESG